MRQLLAGAEVDAESPEERLLPEDSAARPGLDAADVELALRFLPGAGVIVLADTLSESAIAAGGEGASFSSARLVVAGALDAGVDTVAAFEEAVAVSGWERVVV